MASWRLPNHSQHSQPSSPSVFGEGRDGLQLISRLFGGARTDCARDARTGRTLGVLRPITWTLRVKMVVRMCRLANAEGCFIAEIALML